MDKHEIMISTLNSQGCIEHASREEMIIRYTPLVHHVLNRLGLRQSDGADYEDAASQGVIGLIEALDRYKPEFGAQFSTYAIIRIRGSILDYWRSRDIIPRTARMNQRKIEGAKSNFLMKYHRLPTEKELAASLNLTIPALRRWILYSSMKIISLEDFIKGDQREENRIVDLVEDDQQIDPRDEIEEVEILSEVTEAIHTLPVREQKVLKFYYSSGFTYKEIARLLGISESRVCQLHSQIVWQLRGLLSSESTLTYSRGNLPKAKRA
jgi:RNA polymerase sigma factor FliA